MNGVVTSEDLQQIVLSLPEIADWPELAGLFEPRSQQVRLDWQLPALACQAVGGAAELALPAVAAIACLQISIILVDDILDDDPRGEYRRLGAGRTANMALAFEAAALLLLSQAPAAPEARALAATALSRAALRTAQGQDLDVQNLRGEADYWRVVKAKSTPFYGAAFQVGAFLGGAQPAAAKALYNIGVLLGEMVQILDDLMDAFATPANPDWREGRNNLALLYAATAEHPHREELQALLGHVDIPGELHRAQQILLSSGAVSYCLYLLVQRFQSARELLRRAELANPEPVWGVLRQQVAPLRHWLGGLGLPVPPELAQETL